MKYPIGEQVARMRHLMQMNSSARSVIKRTGAPTEVLRQMAESYPLSQQGTPLEKARAVIDSIGTIEPDALVAALGVDGVDELYTKLGNGPNGPANPDAPKTPKTEQQKETARRMGLPDGSPRVERAGRAQIFRPMTPAEARAHLARARS